LAATTRDKLDSTVSYKKKTVCVEELWPSRGVRSL